MSAFGESVTIPSFPRLTAVLASMTDGSYTADDTSITPQEILINLPLVVGFKVTDMMLNQSKVDIRTAFPEAAGRAVNDSLDHEVVKLIPSLTKTAGTLGSDLDDAAVLGAIQSLVTNHVDLHDSNDFVWILPASQFSAVKGLKSYEKSFRIVAGNTNSEGGADVRAAIDTLYGYDIHFRSDSQMTVSGGKVGGLFYRDSVGVAIQRMPSMLPSVRIPGTVNWEMLTMALAGIATIKDEVAVKVLCK